MISSLTYSMPQISREDRLSRSLRPSTTNQSYSDQLEQEISENRKLRRLLQKARRQSRQDGYQLKELEDSVQKHESDLQESWAESHRLLNKLRELKKTRDDSITALQSTVSTKDAELADAAESMQALKAQLSEAQANARVRLNEPNYVKSIHRTKHEQLSTQNAALMSRIEDFAARLENLVATNTELEKSLEESQRETDRAEKSLKDWSDKYECQVCASAANSLTECGHLFCKECLVKREEEWYQASDPYRRMQGTLKGILTCPACRKWVVMSAVKRA
jgi:chromosome segregation ATPase